MRIDSNKGKADGMFSFGLRQPAKRIIAIVGAQVTA